MSRLDDARRAYLTATADAAAEYRRDVAYARSLWEKYAADARAAKTPIPREQIGNFIDLYTAAGDRCRKAVAQARAEVDAAIADARDWDIPIFTNQEAPHA
jgi:hypothetical protein